MGERVIILKPADLRKAVAEWGAAGLRVRILPDGTIDVQPPSERRHNGWDLAVLGGDDEA
jgi:hypothetical protein